MFIKNIIDDGFNSDLIATAKFDGILEFPVIEKCEKIIIPKGIIPFSKRSKSKTSKEFVAFYEPDIKFSDILREPEKFVCDLARFPGIISPDFSLYTDSTLTAQIANAYRDRVIAHYFQKKGFYVIPNVRWGDERSYTTKELPEKFAFLGMPKHSIVSIGTYGCSQSKEEKMHLKNGLAVMLEELEPKVVLVYGSMNDKIFGEYKKDVKFVNYPDWDTFIHKEASHGNK